MPEDAKDQANSSPPDAKTQADTATSDREHANGGSRVNRGVVAALAAAAVGTAVAAAARSRGTSGADSSAEEPAAAEGRTARARGAVRRSEPVLTAAWDAAKGSIEPVTRNGARQAGRFVAERSPEFVRENVIPPFVEGLTSARAD